MSDEDKPAPCPRGCTMWTCGPAQSPHTCPYAEDINGDSETLCECCEKCAHECAMDI